MLESHAIMIMTVIQETATITYAANQARLVVNMTANVVLEKSVTQPIIIVFYQLH